MRISLGYSLALLLALTTSASARPIDRYSELRPEMDDVNLEVSTSGTSNLSSHIFGDTISYGGTYWAADSLRWEAFRDSHWTFDSGVGSSINTGANPNKPIGYHQQMEGWTGIDQTLNPVPYFRRSSTCVIAGTRSLWAGITLAEAEALCWASGQGYGNGWNLTVSKSFAYSGTGNVAFSFQYTHEVESGFDFVYAFIDTSGLGDDVELFNKTGIGSGTEVITLNPGSDMRSDAGTYIVKFVLDADGSYSDEDGLNPTVCGGFAVDNIAVGLDSTDFEAGLNGWAQKSPTTGVGDFSNINLLGDLSPPAVFCPCGLADSVLVFFDTNDGHPLDQDNMAVSPWIDLLAGGDAGRPGKLMLYDVYALSPLANYIFVQLRARFYPDVCVATGKLILTGWRDQSTVFYYGEAPFCNPVTAPRLRDYSAVILAGAQQVQVGFGIISLCRTAPFGPACSGVTNQSPYMDNLSLGVYGNPTRPIITTTAFDRFQDNFASDGSMNPASAGRFDQNRLKGSSTPSVGSILGDTLNARGDGGNVEVRLVFKIETGPFVNGAFLAAYTARWTAEPTLSARYGGTWYSARMDTAQQGATVTNGVWMSTFHETDPGFMGTDTTLDPNDSNRLANDIIPDHVFTPGSRIDYFVASRFIPPDPRNPGGTSWHTNPDTTGLVFREAEILPSSMGADTTWNCVLYVDHHDDRSLPDQHLEETGLRLSLGTGGNNPEGTRHDRWDVQTPSSAQLSFGRPLATVYGASQVQVFFYKVIEWHSATLIAGQLTVEDAAILNPWLLLRNVGNNNFWGSGEGLMQSMQVSGGLAKSFMNNTLGVLQNCTGIRLANCGGAAIDTSYCMPTLAVGGSAFASTIQPRGRGNGCPDVLAFDRLSTNVALATVKGQMSYNRLVPGQGGVLTLIDFASVTNFNTIDVTFKTVLDGISVGRLRSNPGFFGIGCDDVMASYARTDDVLDWFNAESVCPDACYGYYCAVPDGGPPPPPFRHALGNAYPNPMNPTTRIQFTNGVSNGRVKVEIFDVTGRLIRSLVDDKLPAGVHEVTWDGASEGGSTVPSGMYFYRMSAEDFVSAKKLVVSK